MNYCDRCSNLYTDPSPCSKCITDNNEIPSLYTPKPKEAVNHPEHYNQGGIECIEALKACMSEEAFNGFLKGNIIKYMWRYEAKGKPAEDLRKTEFYLSRLIQEVGDCG